jgi:hypothetical protein
MKFSIEGFSQKILLEHGLDHKDALILRFIKDFIASGKLEYKIIQGEIFYWINYATVLNEIPLIDIKTSKHLGDRIKKYVRTGLFKRHFIVNYKGRYGTNVYLSPCKLLHKLDYTTASGKGAATASKRAAATASNRAAATASKRAVDPSTNDPVTN